MSDQKRRTVYVKTGSCKYNTGIMCDCDDTCDCSKCGWNPKVEKRRRERIELKYHLETVDDKLVSIYNQFRAGRISREEAHEKFDDMKTALLGSLKNVQPLK